MIKVGIIGFGTVGEGTVKILRESQNLIKKRTGLDVRLVKIADTDLEKRRRVKVEEDLLTENAFEIIEDKEIDIVVELIGGIHPAYEYICEALKRGKWVVTANKALLAEKGIEIFKLAKEKNCEVGFEASVCGGIPVIKAIRDGLIGNRITSILGILNGTSNYILTRMEEEESSFHEALSEAQRSGFAEKDPSLDVDGIDAAHKLSILILVAFHHPVSTKEVAIRGIRKIDKVDIKFAKEFGYKIKLLAVAKLVGDEIEARVEPVMLPLDHPLSSVDGVYNGVYIVGDRTGPNLYYGKGAGGDPTGSAVVSDILDMAMRMEAGRRIPRIPVISDEIKGIKKVDEAYAPFYMRFIAEDRPGVLSKISGVLAEYNISIQAVIQKGRKEGGWVPIVMLLHEAEEASLKKAKEEIDRLPFIKEESLYLRIEELNI
ncbi:MAG: homoserine dehydrogenase [Desulfobacterota bacterium]|nr:homoserine dehydrogenase [Thermodesulfobacteriota bacterium]MDW8001932.1 homoserine dehydrogenase [Deltaproteobacteria bacterium]